MTTRRGTLALAVLGAAAGVLIALELALGALSFGQPHLADPCTSKPAFSGGGLDGATQRFALETLAGAACELHTTREELVLSFVPNAGTERIHWDQATIDAALKAGPRSRCPGHRRQRICRAGAGLRAARARRALDRMVPRNRQGHLTFDFSPPASARAKTPRGRQKRRHE